MAYTPIKFQDKFQKFSETWTPKILTKFDSSYLKVVKMHGESVWHSHEDTDRAFIVIAGKLRILFRNGEVVVNPGECFVVLKGIEHKPIAADEVQCVLIDQSPTLDTWDTHSNAHAVSRAEWI